MDKERLKLKKYANSSLTRLKSQNMVGFGNARITKTVSTDMRFQMVGSCVPKLLIKKNLTLEDVIEKERMKLTGELTPLTKDLFDAWKEKWLKRMKDDKDNEIKKELASKKKDKKFLDPNFKFLSGRTMFVYNPDDALDEEGDDDDNDLQELIRNRKRQNIDGDEEEEGNIDDVELPDEEGDDDLVDNCEMPDDID